MKHVYVKSSKIMYNNQYFRIIVRDDNKLGFLKIVVDGDQEKYELPTALEFLHLSSCYSANRIKF